jgi:hypothetical protein
VLDGQEQRPEALAGHATGDIGRDVERFRALVVISQALTALT